MQRTCKRVLSLLFFKILDEIYYTLEKLHQRIDRLIYYVSTLVSDETFVFLAIVHRKSQEILMDELKNERHDIVLGLPSSELQQQLLSMVCIPCVGRSLFVDEHCI